MPKIRGIFRVILIVFTLTTLNAGSLSAEYLPVFYPNTPELSFQYANVHLWAYLRLGLNYLESPKPLLPPETVPPDYIHPDLKGFGPYGFSPQAYADVQRLYPFFKAYGWEEIMNSQKLYDLANQAFADWLLANLQDRIPKGASKQEVFDTLHRAWNLGLAGFKNGREVVSSRKIRAEEFKTNSYL